MVERVLLGKHPDTGVVGLWVSRPTKNARTSTDLADFLVHPDKINQRPFLRYTPIKWARGSFVGTTTFSDGTKADNYNWTADFYHNFGYVPVVVTEMGTNTPQNPWIDAAKISPGVMTMYVYRYNAGSPNTPIAGTQVNGPDWFWDTSDDTINWIGTGVGRSQTFFTVYRNSIT